MIRVLQIITICISLCISLASLPLLLPFPDIFLGVLLSASTIANQHVNTNTNDVPSLLSASQAPSAETTSRLKSSLSLPALKSENITSENMTAPTNEAQYDSFGITKIYPTKEGGREWFINMSDPKSTPNFSITDNTNLSRLPDGAWRINTSHVRMVINTSEDQAEWKNTEVTGYVRLSYLNGSQPGTVNEIQNSSFSDPPVRSAAPDDEESGDLVFISRSGRHSSEVPCEGTAYNGDLHLDGSVGWKKEIWHTGGYTEERARHTVADLLLNKWVGWKVVVYNIEMDNNTTAVKLESYLDESKLNNNWTKVTDLIDSGGWYANTNNSEFFRAGCDKVKDHIITDGGPYVVFRTDNLILDFKNLSIREIQPPLNVNLTSVIRL